MCISPLCQTPLTRRTRRSEPVAQMWRYRFADTRAARDRRLRNMRLCLP